MKTPVIFHVDMDAFYASVEQLDRPELAGRPVIVGGSAENRGVVSACSYEARAYGVHSAMPMFQARRLCPSAVVLQGRMKRYQEVSREIMEIFDSFAPSVQQISIDEAFLDMTGTEGICGPPAEAGTRLKELIRETVGLAVSVGIGPSKFIAKMASDYRKPDGLFEVKPGEETAFIDTLPIEKLWGIGAKTCAQIRARGFSTPETLRRPSQQVLQQYFGRSLGLYLYAAVRGIDPGIFPDRPQAKSVSNEETFSRDICDKQEISRYLLDLSHQVMFRTMDEGLTGCTAAVKYRLSDFRTFTCRATEDQPFTSAEQLYRRCRELLFERWDGVTPLRLVGVGLTSLREAAPGSVQGTLFGDDYEKQRSVEEAVHQLQRRGRKVMKASSMLKGFEKKRK